MSNWKYASLVVAIGAAISSILLQLDVSANKWVPAALSAVAVITGVFSPAPNVGKKQNGG